MKTTNYNFNLIEKSDRILNTLDDLNENFNNIDSELYEKEKELATTKQKLERTEQRLEKAEKKVDQAEAILDTSKSSGENVYFDNAKNYPLMGLKGDGKSEQITTTGKNLIDLTQLNANTPISMKVSACDKSNVKSNSITLTAGGTWSNLFFVFPENYFAKNEDIVVCANFLETIAGRTSPVGFVISGSNNNVDYTEIKRAYPINAEYNKSTFISLTANVETYKYIRIRIWINSTATEVTPSESVVNVSEVMIARGTDDTYEPYTGNQPAPNPEYPQEIKTIQAYNLFDKDNAPVIYGYTSSSTGTIVADSTTRLSYIKCKPNTTYTAQKISGYLFNLSYSNIEPAIGTSFEGRKSSNGTVNTITTGANAQYLIIEYYKNDSNVKAILDSIQICERNKLKPYAPYGCISYKGVKKNILKKHSNTGSHTIYGVTVAQNEDGTFTINGTASDTFWLEYVFDFKNATNYKDYYTLLLDSSKQYTHSIVQLAGIRTGSMNSTLGTNLIADSSGNKVANFNKPVTFSGVEGISRGFLWIAKDSTYSNVIIGVQLEVGDTATEFEPNHESTLPIDLKGNELASVGTVSDKLLIDRKGNVAIEKNVGKRIFTGAEEENWVFYSATLNNFEMVLKSVPLYKNDSVSRIISNTFLGVMWKDSWTKNNSITIGGGNNIFVRTDKYNTIEDFKAFLSEQNLIIYYVLKNPQLISLGTIENPEIFKGINNIVVETNLGNMNVEVEYVEDTRKVFEERLANLEQAFVALGGI